MTEEMRQEARDAYRIRKDYHANTPSNHRYGADQRPTRDNDRRLLMSLLAEICMGRLFRLAVAPAIAPGERWVNRPDLETGVEVRYTEMDPPFLLLHARDKDMPHLLVTGDKDLMTVHGWALPKEAEGWWNDELPYPCFAIPAYALHHMPIPPAEGRPVAMRHRPLTPPPESEILSA